jgi:hypothetical protein
LKNNSFIFINLLCKALNKSLLRKYCKERAYVVTLFFWALQTKKKMERENTKNIYISEKNILERPKDHRRLVEEDKI